MPGYRDFAILCYQWAAVLLMPQVGSKYPDLACIHWPSRSSNLGTQAQFYSKVNYHLFPILVPGGLPGRG